MKTTHTRYVRANDARGLWAVYEEASGGDCWLMEFESESMAYEFAAAPDLLAACREVIEHIDEHPAHLPLTLAGNKALPDGVLRNLRDAISKAEGRQ